MGLQYQKCLKNLSLQRELQSFSECCEHNETISFLPNHAQGLDVSEEPFPYLPPRQPLTLPSEATPMASPKDISSPHPALCTDKSAPLEAFLGAPPRSGNHCLPPCYTWRPPAATYAMRHHLKPQPCDISTVPMSILPSSWQGSSQRDVATPFFRRRNFVQAGARGAVPAGLKSENGWRAACFCWFRDVLAGSKGAAL